MKFEHYLKELEKSSEFKKFKKENPKAYLGAGFFVIDLEGGKNTHQLDFVLPDNKIATFILDDGVKMKISEQALKKDLKEVKQKVNTDIDALHGIAEDEMKNQTVTENIRKIIAILHMMDDKLVWNLQCILGGLGILQVHIDDSDKSILKFEKHSLMELVRPQMGVQLPEGRECKEDKGKALDKLKELVNGMEKQMKGKVDKKSNKNK